MKRGIVIMKKITVLGSGSWGSTLANILAENDYEVCLYGIEEDVAAEINNLQTNSKYLANFKFSKPITATTDLAEAVKDASGILFVIPTAAIASVSKQLKPLLSTANNPILMSATKGIEPGTKRIVSQIIEQEFDKSVVDNMVVISGPSHAENASQKDLTTLSVASYNEENAKTVQQMFTRDYVRLYTNSDPIGVEVGGAIKNVLALAAGMIAGKGYEINALAALITRGIRELALVGEALGGQKETFYGLSGIGDLIVTASSSNSRNWRAGKQLAEGKSLDDVVNNMGMVVEGVKTAQAVHELAEELNLDLPISEAVYRVLYEQTEVEVEITNMMHRPLKPEFQ